MSEAVGVETGAAVAVTAAGEAGVPGCAEEVAAGTGAAVAAIVAGAGGAAADVEGAFTAGICTDGGCIAGA